MHIKMEKKKKTDYEAFFQASLVKFNNDIINKKNKYYKLFI